MLEIEIDGKKLNVPSGTTVIEAARLNGTYIPHFCYHKKLSIAANCRMCLVQVEKAPKPLPACATPVTDGMKVFTHSDMAVKAQKGVMEFLLINHPLDCPICDQGGECQLQDLAVGYGGSNSRYEEDKRVVANKDLGPLISTDMTRCIHCTRCVRFTEEVAGLQEMGMAGRGEHSEIMSFIGMTVDSEISGNVIDLCPVGALTSKPFRYSARTWELSRRRSVSPHDGMGTNLLVQVKQDRVMRVLPLENESVNECWISDRDRFSYEALNSSDRLTRPMLKQGGQWLETDWQTALEYVANGLKSVVRDYGADSVSFIGTPHSTLEELYLLNRLALGLGAPSAEFGSRNADERITDIRQDAFWLGQSISALLKSELILVVGATLRKEQPLLAQRIRQSVRKGTRLALINPHDDDLLCKVAGKLIVRPDQMVEALAAVVKAVAEIKGIDISENIPNQVTSNSFANVLAQLLVDEAVEGKTSILLGNLSAYHPRAAELAVLVDQLARMTGATVGWMSDAANTVGAQLMGLSSCAGAYARSAKAYVLFNTEPELDSYNPHRALQAVQAAEMVVALSSFKHQATEYADVLLPIAPFSETGGTFVSMEGVLNSFNGVVKPLGDTRPGWKVLRVLGKLLGLNDFEFDTVEQVRNKALPKGSESIASGLSNAVNRIEISHTPVGNGFSRLAEVPIYQADALTRRAVSLQKTKDAQICEIVRLSPGSFAALGFQEGDNAVVTQGEGIVLLPAVVDGGLPDGVVRLATAHVQMAKLGGMFDPVEIAKE